MPSWLTIENDGAAAPVSIRLISIPAARDWALSDRRRVERIAAPRNRRAFAGRSNPRTIGPRAWSRRPAMASDVRTIATIDVAYLHHGGKPLAMRVFAPEGDGPFPAVIDLHGGAWNRGDLTTCRDRDEALADSGIVAAGDRFPPCRGRLSGLARRHQLRHSLVQGACGRVRRGPRPRRPVRPVERRPSGDAGGRCGRTIRATPRSLSTAFPGNSMPGCAASECHGR